jgi:hypothetical protein
MTLVRLVGLRSRQVEQRRALVCLRRTQRSEHASGAM